MNNTAGIFFSYSSQNDADYLMDNVEGMALDKVVLAIGGEITLQETALDKDDGKVVLLFEKNRLGKAESYNRALKCLDSDITFLVSGDVRFEHAIFTQLAGFFDEDVGMVIPRVVPSPCDSFPQKVGSIMWMIHDITMELASAHSKYFCGGEFQAMRHPMPLFSPEIVNDDEFLCHQVYASGKRIVYARGIEVSNSMPTSFRSLLQQRTRINFGHIQSKRHNNWHSSISLGGFRNIGESLRVIRSFQKRYGKQRFLLSVAILIETISILIAFAQFRSGKSYRFWHLQSSER